MDPVQQTQAPQQTDNSQVQQAPENLNPNPTPPVVEEDLVSRASQVSLDGDEPINDVPGDDIVDQSGKFNRQEWEAMLSKLPAEQRGMLESAYKSLQAGADKKFQAAAERLRQAEEATNQPWTQQRIQSLLQDPAFVQEAQRYAQQQSLAQNPSNSGVSDEEWSALSDNEKRQFHQLVASQRQLQGEMNKMKMQQEDERLKQRYKNYQPDKVNKIREDLLSGRVQATSEHLWKVVDYEEYGKRCYKLGQEDRKIDIQGKHQASTAPMGMNVTQTREIPVREKGEHFLDHWRKIAKKNFEEARSMKRQ